MRENPHVEDIFTRIEGETDKSWEAFQAYAAMGPHRNLKELIAEFKKSRSAPTRSYETLRTWCKNYRWNDRIQEHEVHALAEVRTDALSDRKTEYLRNVAEYQEALQISGQTGMQGVNAAKQILLDWLQLLAKDGRVPNGPEVDRLIKALSSLEAKSAEEWNQALAIDSLMEKLQNG